MAAVAHRVPGTDGSKEHESMDRLDVVLPTIQSELALAIIAAVDAKDSAANTARGIAGTTNAAAEKPRTKVVLVILNYGEISTEELNGGLSALLMAFMPHYATPIAEVLFGVVSPGGKLPYTVYPNNYTVTKHPSAPKGFCFASLMGVWGGAWACGASSDGASPVAASLLLCAPLDPEHTFWLPTICTGCPLS